MPTVDIQQAEQGATVRFNYVTLSGGVPYTPMTLAVRVHPGQNVLPITAIAGLNPLSVGPAGRYYSDWDIPLATPPGFYTLYVEADGGAYTNMVAFEIAAAGTYTKTPVVTPQKLMTTVQQISKASNEAIFVGLVRTLLRDHPQLNRLTTGRETDDGVIRACMYMALSQYNSTPPPIAQVQFGNFPSVGNLAIGTIGWVLNSSFLLRMRNNLQYSDGGITVDTENMQAYMQAGNMYQQMFQQWVQQYKIAKNLNDAFGGSPTGVHSEYFLLSAMLGDSTWGGGSGSLLQ